MAKAKNDSKVARNASVDQVKFVQVVTRVALSGGSVNDAAAELGMKPGSVTTRASIMRADGLALPKFQKGGGGRKRDVGALNDLIAQVRESVAKGNETVAQ